jgi:sugar-specific transcriptional regulator TrmB
MIVNQELVKKIKDYFNLNIYETKVWLALLSKGIASAGEIAELSGVPRSRTYDVLESLEKQGFALAKIGKPTKYIAVKPLSVLERLKKNTVENANEKVKILDSLKGTREYTELEALQNSSTTIIRKEDISSSIKGRSAILSHARELLENAEKEIVICLPAFELAEKGRIFSSLFEKLKKENISIKVAVKGSDEELKKIQDKYKIKLIKTNLHSKFFIIDRKQLLFTLTNSSKEEDEIAVWLNSEFFSQAFASMFENSMRR